MCTEDIPEVEHSEVYEDHHQPVKTGGPNGLWETPIESSENYACLGLEQYETPQELDVYQRKPEKQNFNVND